MYAASSSAGLLVSHTSRHPTTQPYVHIQVLWWLQQRLRGSTVISQSTSLLQDCSTYRSDTCKQLQQLSTWCPPTPLEGRKYLLQPFKLSSHLKLTPLTLYNYFCGPLYQFPIRHRICPSHWLWQEWIWKFPWPDLLHWQRSPHHYLKVTVAVADSDGRNCFFPSVAPLTRNRSTKKS